MIPHLPKEAEPVPAVDLRDGLVGVPLRNQAAGDVDDALAIGEAVEVALTEFERVVLLPSPQKRSSFETGGQMPFSPPGAGLS